LSVSLREVADDDVAIFFEHQRDPVAVEMAGFPAREREAHDAHWAKIRADPANYMRTIEADGVVVGNVVSWQGEEGRLVGYWVGREHWGKGIATAALRACLDEISERPVYALVVSHNAGSIRVLEKCGFVQVGEDEEGPVFRLDAAAESSSRAVP